MITDYDIPAIRECLGCGEKAGEDDCVLCEPVIVQCPTCKAWLCVGCREEAGGCLVCKEEEQVDG